MHTKLFEKSRNTTWPKIDTTSSDIDRMTRSSYLSSALVILEGSPPIILRLVVGVLKGAYLLRYSSLAF